jgi:hypothetical protein
MDAASHTRGKMLLCHLTCTRWTRGHLGFCNLWGARAGSSSVKDIFSSMQHHPEHARRQPDGVFCYRHEAKYVLVDFTRGYGWTREALAKQEDTKRRAYDQLMRDLQVKHMVKFFPLACGYNGAIAVDMWRALLDRLDIHPASQDRVLKLAVRAICLGFSTMVDIRHCCRKATEASGQPG